MTECTLHNLLTSCQFEQVFWIYRTNDCDQNILLAKGTKQEMFADEDVNFELIDHINDVVEYWTIRTDGAMFVRLRMTEQAEDLWNDHFVQRWDWGNPLKRPWVYSAEMDDFTHCIYGSVDYLHPYGDPLECQHWDKREEDGGEQN